MLFLRFTLPSSNITLINRNQYNSRKRYPKIFATSSSNINVTTEVTLPEGLKHVAVIMDGHRRWAKLRGLPQEQCQLAGAEKMKFLTRLCSKWGVKVFTVFAFSTKHWLRPKEEVDFLMDLFLEMAISSDYLDECIRDGRRVSIIGDTSILSKSLCEALTLVEEKTKTNSGLHVMVAINYGGRHDTIQATKRIASKVNNGLIKVDDIDQNLFEQELETHCVEFPHPDLLIRTSGEQRISNFMLWQLAYTELYFAKKKFPDMEEADFVEAFMSFQPRHRRYGGSNIQEMKIPS